MSGTAFRDTERRYRACAGLGSLPDDAIDFNNAASLSRLKRLDASIPVFELPRRPGVLLLPGVLSQRDQRIWTLRCVEEYSGSRSNLHAEYALPRRGTSLLWQHAASELLSAPSASAAKRPRLDLVPPPAGLNGRPTATSYSTLLGRLRWTTLGYHYDWTARNYPAGDVEPFPAELAALCAATVAQMDPRAPPFVAEAAIVNYYGSRDTLTGHRDDSEEDMSAPLLSFSLGLAAVFLVGGATRDEAPDAIVVRSGDAVVMRGPARLAYHGVPKVFAESAPVWLTNAALYVDDDDVEAGERARFKRVAEYVRAERINLNVRQVKPHG